MRLQAAGESLTEFGDKATLIIRSNYANMKEELHRDWRGKGWMESCLDLGVSSFQLDTPERGFTYRESRMLHLI